MDLVNRVIQENLTAIRVVKSTSAGTRIQKFDEVNTNLRNTSERAFRLAALNMPVMQFILYGTILSILWFGGNLASVGGLKVGEPDRLPQLRDAGAQLPDDALQRVSDDDPVPGFLEADFRVMDEEIDIRDDQARDIRVERGTSASTTSISNIRLRRRSVLRHLLPHRTWADRGDHRPDRIGQEHAHPADPPALRGHLRPNLYRRDSGAAIPPA